MEIPDDKLDAAVTFSSERLRTVNKIKHDLGPVTNRMLNVTKKMDIGDLEDSLDTLASSLRTAVAENYDALGEFAGELEDGQADIQNQRAEVDMIRQLEANLANARKNKIMEYKTALDNLANKTKLIDVFNLASINPPAEGHSFFHKLFSWCVEILYESPATLYDWENFRTECFINDYGVDFIMRLRGTQVAKFTTYQYTITKALQRYDTYLRTAVPNTDFHKLLDCILFIIEAYEARDKFVKAKEAHKVGCETHRGADLALKVDSNLKEKLSDFIVYSLSVQNTLNDTLDWLYWCRGKFVHDEKSKEELFNPLDFLTKKQLGEEIELANVQDLRKYTQNCLHAYNPEEPKKTFTRPVERTSYGGNIDTELDIDGDEGGVNPLGQTRALGYNTAVEFFDHGVQEIIIEEKQPVGSKRYYKREGAPENLKNNYAKGECNIF